MVASGPGRFGQADEADAVPTRSLGDAAVVLVPARELVEEANDPGPSARRDVVERDDAARPDERREQLEVASDAVVGVIGVDEQEVDRTTGEDSLEALDGSRIVTVDRHQQFDALLLESESAPHYRVRRPAAEHPERADVEGDEEGVIGGCVRP